MTYTYLIISLLLLLLPFVFALDRKHFKLAQLKSTLLPSFLVAIVFSEVTVFFALKRIWMFNPVYVSGNYYRAVPVEGYLFLFAISFAGLAIYNYLNARFPKNDLQKYSLAISNLILGICIAILFFAHKFWFPLVTATMTVVLILCVEYMGKLRFMYRFYRAFLVCLVPFYIVYGIIGNLPLISYSKAESVDVSFANIPAEINLFLMGMLLLGVYLVEYFKARTAR